MEKHTYEEIKNYIKNNYYYLNLTDNELESYIKYIQKLEWYIEHHKNSNIDDAFEYFQKRFEELYSLFKEEGYDDETSLILTKKTITNSDRKNLMVNLNFIRAINLEENAIKSGTIFMRRHLDISHARKAYLVSINRNDAQTLDTLIRITNDKFNSKFNVNIEKLLEQFPVTEELKQVWGYQAKLTNEKLKEEFGLTRETLAAIYPTTADELETIRTVGKLKDEEIKNKYGISKEELLKKHPLNRDTLKALATINKSKDTTVEKIFNQPKDQVLKLRTITTEMIILANKQFKLNHSTYTKEELKERLKKSLIKK